MNALRAILALEFCAALASWAVLGVEWWATDAIAAASLVAFLCTYPEPHGPGEASRRPAPAVAPSLDPFCRCEYPDKAHAWRRCRTCGGH